MKFKVGDRVKYTSGSWGDSRINPLWNGIYGKIIGTVILISQEECWIRVKWNNGRVNGYEKHDLVKIENNTVNNILPDILFEI